MLHGHGQLPVRKDGFMEVSKIITERALAWYGATQDDVLDIVENAVKQRFRIVTENGKHWIRALQGHNSRFVEEAGLDMESILEPFTPNHPRWVSVGLHGTFRANWSSISVQGLNRRGREHIHMVAVVTGRGPTSGVRDGTDVIIQVDLEALYRVGVKIQFAEATGVILTSGINGNIPPRFIIRITEKSTGKELWRSEEHTF